MRLVRESDSRDLWLWRNDEDTRAASLSTAPVEWSDHERWFENVLHDPARTIYIAEMNAPDETAVAMGMCRFDVGVEGTDAEVSLNLDRHWRGRRLAVPLLEAAITAYSSRATSVLTLSAVIRPANAASRAAFVRAGFASTDVVDDVEHYVKRLRTQDAN